MPFFNKHGVEISPKIVTDIPVAIDLNDGVVAPLDSAHEIKVIPAGSMVELLDTANGPALRVWSFEGIPIMALSLRPGSVNFGVITDAKTGTQVVDPDIEIQVK